METSSVLTFPHQSTIPFKQGRKSWGGQRESPILGARLLYTGLNPYPQSRLARYPINALLHQLLSQHVFFFSYLHVIFPCQQFFLEYFTFPPLANQNSSSHAVTIELLQITISRLTSLPTNIVYRMTQFILHLSWSPQLYYTLRSHTIWNLA